MKRIIRGHIWETNSSASHAFIILSEEDAKRWEEDDDLYAVKDIWYTSKEWDPPIDKTKLYTKDELIKYIKHNHGLDYEEYDDEDEIIRDEGFINSSGWDEIELEEDSETFTTPSGDKMVAYFKYGYDY